MKKALKKPDLIADILKKTLKKVEISDKIANYEVFLKWSDIVGANIAKYSKPKLIRKDHLIVEVEHVSWKVELNFLKEKILKQIQKKYPNSKLRDLDFILKS